MFSKQLFIGLAAGALCAGLGFVLFSGDHVPDSALADADNLKLLAQVIPNESASTTEESPEDSGSEGGVIEVRTSAPLKNDAPKTVVTKVSAVAASEPEPIIESAEPEPAKCLFASGGDKPALLGIISEVAWMGSADDANAEWVEIQNHFRGELDISGWQLIDKAQQIQAIVPDGVVLPLRGFLIFERGEHRLSGTTVSYNGVLSNSNEGLRLFNADCDLQDEVLAGSKWPAGTNNPKRTAERESSLKWHTYYGSGEAGILGTPGEKNSMGEPKPVVVQQPIPEPTPTPEPEPVPVDMTPASTTDPIPDPAASSSVSSVVAGQIIISEVVAGTASGAGDEFIELHNTTDAEIDMTGFSMKKKVLSSGSESSLVTTVNFEGKKIGAGQRFIIGHGVFTAQSQMTWPTSYSVAYTGNAILLYNTQGEKIDEVSWELSSGQSYACASQGSCAVQEVPSPGN